MAGNLKAVGYAGLTFGPVVVDYGPKGCTTHFTVSCPQIIPLVEYYNYVVMFGASGSFHGLDVGVDGVTTAEEKKLTVSIPGVAAELGGLISQLYFDQWELLTNEGADTILSNPLMVGGTYTNGTVPPYLNYNATSILAMLIQNGGKLQDACDSANDNLVDILLAGGTIHQPLLAEGGNGYGQFTIGTFTARQNQIALELCKGQTQWYNPTYVLRHTSYCNPNALYNASIANANKLYSPAQLLIECGSGWTYNLPARIYSKIASIPIQLAAEDEADYYTWGWLKKITREPVLANFMVEVSVEYELNLWSNLRYGLYGT